MIVHCLRSIAQYYQLDIPDRKLFQNSSTHATKSNTNAVKIILRTDLRSLANAESHACLRGVPSAASLLTLSRPMVSRTEGDRAILEWVALRLQVGVLQQSPEPNMYRYSLCCGDCKTPIIFFNRLARLFQNQLAQTASFS